MQRIGFIGLGLMGQPISRRLLTAGHPLAVWNRTAEKARSLLAAGAAWADSPAALAAASDVVITMVTDSAASEAVICGEGGVLGGAPPLRVPRRFRAAVRPAVMRPERPGRSHLGRDERRGVRGNSP